MGLRLQQLYRRRYLFGAVTALGYLSVACLPPAIDWARGLFNTPIVTAAKSDKSGLTVVGKVQPNQQLAWLETPDPFKTRWPKSISDYYGGDYARVGDPPNKTPELIGTKINPDDFEPSKPGNGSHVAGSIKTAESDDLLGVWDGDDKPAIGLDKRSGRKSGSAVAAVKPNSGTMYTEPFKTAQWGDWRSYDGYTDFSSFPGTVRELKLLRSKEKRSNLSGWVKTAV